MEKAVWGAKLTFYCPVINTKLTDCEHFPPAMANFWNRIIKKQLILFQTCIEMLLKNDTRQNILDNSVQFS